MANFIFFIITILSLFFYTQSLTQSPDVDSQLKKKMIEHKASHYRQLFQNELQITANQNAYDVIHYDLDLIPNPSTEILQGTVKITGRVKAASLNFVELNFWSGMSVSKIYPAGLPESVLTYNRGDELLSIQLEKTYVQSEIFSVIIDYSGQPQNSPYYSFSFDSFEGQPMIWTMSSVFGARAWWPCKDVPLDKPDSVDIRVTVPENQIVVSNGSLRKTTSQQFQKTYWWHESYPIATYLVFLAIYPYEQNFDDYIYNNGADTMKIHFYTFPGNYQEYVDINEKVKDMLSVFSNLFGEYPFVTEKYGQADYLWGGGMEHQTCTTYGRWDETLYAHEIAHQWWGDMITCESFHHIWLNEGFASYSEPLWYEHLYPGYTASEYQMDFQLYLGPGTIYVEDPYNENIFDLGLSYYKGSWVLHMLRHITGDEAFFDILRTYYASSVHQYGTATTTEFQSICEQESGLNLEKFFHQWIYEEYCPHYSYTWSWERNGMVYDIQLELEQLQSNHIFWMPVDITISTASGETTKVVWDSLQSQSFQFSVNSEPLELEIDKNNWILKTVEETFTGPQFDRGILLVNGVYFETDDIEIRNAYESKAFWGDLDISFWDCFDTPDGGYPSTLPEPIGHGKIPTDILGRYSMVIWIGNNYAGDVGKWQQSPIHQYLETGGNVILLTRNGQAFIYGDLQEYLGITWTDNSANTLHNCEAVYPGLQSMQIIGDQSSNAVFDTDLHSQESLLLFRETDSFEIPRGLGVWRKSGSGGSYQENGGNFVFISGRPYRYDPAQLRPNIEFIVKNLFNEPDTGQGTHLSLLQNYPNPFSRSTKISYHLPVNGDVKIEIYNILGQKVETLINARLSAGEYQTKWDASHHPAGIYFLRLNTGEKNHSNLVKTRKIVLLN